MLEQDRLKIINDLVNGCMSLKIVDDYILLRNPTKRQRLQAQLIHDRLLETYKFSDILTLQDVKELLIGEGLVSVTFDANIKELTTNLENTKVELYKNALAGDVDKNKIRNRIRLIKSKMIELMEKRHSLDYLTLEGIAQNAKNKYLVYSNLYNSKMKKIKRPDYRLVEAVTRLKPEIEPNIEQLREIARTEPWQSYWRISGFKFFRNYIELSPEQKNLMLISKMYDNAYSNPECPGENIIEDDDMFDGWMIAQKRARDTERSKKTIEDSLGKQAHHEELFIPVRDAQHAAQINDLNSFESKMIKQQRERVIQSKGSVSEMELPDVQLALQMATNKAFSEAVKGK